MRDNPQAFSQREKLQMLQFISDQYCDHIGAPRTVIKTYNDPQNSNTHGYYGVGGKTIDLLEYCISRISEIFPSASECRLPSENTHCAQYFNPNMYGNPIISRIMRANFRAYQSFNDNYKAYRSQLVEAGAFAAGDAAEQLLRALPANRANDNQINFRPANTARPASTWSLAA